MPITPREAIPRDWTRKIGTGELGIGYDIATTEKDTSNPSSITVTEKVLPFYVQRLVLRWKTKDPDVAMQMLAVVFGDLAQAKHRVRRLCVDASNERYFAKQVQQRFSPQCPVYLIVSGEKTEWRGELMDYKTLLGSLYVNTFTDGNMRMPDVRWLQEDHRLVKKEAGRFVAALATDGSHADTFDSGKLSRYALEGTGRAEAHGVAVGQSAGSVPGGRIANQLKNPLLRRAVAAQRNRSQTHA